MKPNHFCHSPNQLLYVTLESSIKDGTCLKSDIEYLISCSMRMASYHRGEWQPVSHLKGGNSFHREPLLDQRGASQSLLSQPTLGKLCS